MFPGSYSSYEGGMGILRDWRDPSKAQEHGIPGILDFGIRRTDREPARMHLNRGVGFRV